MSEAHETMTEQAAPTMQEADKMYKMDDAVVKNADVQKLNAMVGPGSQDGIPAGVAAVPNKAETEQQRAQLEENLAELYKQRERTALQLQATGKPSPVGPAAAGLVTSGAVGLWADRVGNAGKALDRMTSAARDSLADVALRDANGAISTDATEKVKDAISSFVPTELLDTVTAKITKFAVELKGVPSGIRTNFEKIISQHNFEGITDIEAAVKNVHDYAQKTAGKAGLEVIEKEVNGKIEFSAVLNLTKPKDLANALGVKPALIENMPQPVRDGIVAEIQNTTGWLHHEQTQLMSKEAGGILEAVTSKITNGKLGNAAHTISETMGKGPLPKTANIALAVLATVGTFVVADHVLSSKKRNEHANGEKKMSHLDQQIARAKEALQQQPAGMAI